MYFFTFNYPQLDGMFQIITIISHIKRINAHIHTLKGLMWYDTAGDRLIESSGFFNCEYVLYNTVFNKTKIIRTEMSPENGGALHHIYFAAIERLRVPNLTFQPVKM